MHLSIIVATAKDGVIGLKNRLPWHLPEDLKRFKELTLGKPVIMGRKTFESIGRPLPGRCNIVITRDKSWQHPGIIRVHSLPEAVAAADEMINRRVNENEDGVCAMYREIMVIGGAEIYRQALDDCKTIYLTEIEAEIEGDAYFPSIDKSAWRETQRISRHNADGLHYSFVILQRQGAVANVCRSNEKGVVVF